MTRRLIEEWLPIAELSEESVRERRSMTALPPIYYLHVWWARRPLVSARAAILASLLPHDADKKRFMHTLGIHGDPVAAKERIAKATREGVRLGADAYGYKRAFSYSPSNAETDEWIPYEYRRIGIETTPKVLDPTAGGGSIPFEAARLRFDVFCNDLNPVAALIEKLTIEYPLEAGDKIYPELQRIGKIFTKRVREKLQWLFPPEESDDYRPDGYLFARTIRCPYCGGLIPLSPNWRLTPDGTGVRLIPNEDKDESNRICSFKIVHNSKEQSEGTVSGGRATCPFTDCGRVIDGDQVKTIAQDGGIGDQLYSVVYKERTQTFTKTGKLGKEKWVRRFRTPRQKDDIFDDIKTKLIEKLPEWEARDIVPSESIPHGLKTSELLRYGSNMWRDLFSPRQLYCHCTSVEVFRELLEEEKGKSCFGEIQKTVFLYIALAIDKFIDYNSRLTTWEVTKQSIGHTFANHAFPMKWSYAEMAPLIVGQGYDWVIGSMDEALTEFIKYLRPDVNIKALKSTSKHTVGSLIENNAYKKFNPPRITLSNKSGDALDHIPDHSIDAVVMDPPYYDNVMYAELSDFFYVWLKRTAGYVYPELFTRMLTDKENEAVANPAKFKGEKKPKDLAYHDYRNRMAAIFAECHRVLTDDGVLMLMFTHKATGAWDALAKGLMDAGFVISASWPVNTEAGGSLHIKDKAAANSTIFLVCRPRPKKEDDAVVFWEDLEPQVKKAVLERVESFRTAGITGIDLYLACFGPALEIFSRHWPVKRGTPKPAPPAKRGTQGSLLEQTFDPYETTPEDVLTTARAAVKSWVLQRILQVQKQTDLDPLLEWFVLAWETFKAPQFAYDEALNLSRVVGLDLDRDVIGVIAEKKASDVVIWDSATRAAKASLGPSGGSRSMLDAIHHAAHTARKHNLQMAWDNLKTSGLEKDTSFMDGLRAVLEVLPISRQFTGVDVVKACEPSASDFEALENLRKLAFQEKMPVPTRLTLMDFA